MFVGGGLQNYRLNYMYKNIFIYYIYTDTPNTTPKIATLFSTGSQSHIDGNLDNAARQTVTCSTARALAPSQVKPNSIKLPR
jgi:hypothetical protein